jgi:hypothetical protein
MTFDNWKTTNPADEELGDVMIKHPVEERTRYGDTEYLYRGYIISYWMKPIPTRGNDWDWRHEDFDLDDNRYGTSASLEDAKADIDEQIDDEEFEE